MYVSMYNYYTGVFLGIELMTHVHPYGTIPVHIMLSNSMVISQKYLLMI